MTDSSSRADDGDIAVETAVVDNCQFVTFEVGGEVFAVDMNPVQEIIRVPDIVRVPLAPGALNGLSNLRGRVLPIVSLRHMFNYPERDHDESTRAVVIDLGQPLGFVVDRVSSVINVERQQIESVDGIRSSIDTRLLTGLLKNVGGFPMVMILDFERLIEREFTDIGHLSKLSDLNPLGNSHLSLDSGTAHVNDELQLVSFSVMDQEYAIDIGRVQEIVQVPKQVVHVPNSPAHVIGLMTLRERLLPLVSLRSLFGMPHREPDERARVVVVSIEQVAVGIVTDSVSEVLRVSKSIVDDMPPLLASQSDMADIGQICRIDGGKRLVSIVSADHLFRDNQVLEALTAVDPMMNNTQSGLDDEHLIDDEEQVVVFRLAEGEFGVPIESVQEIVRVPEELTHVPMSPYFVEGVINLRGMVLPVIDQRKRLDLPTIERNDRQRIMVFLIDGVRTGFIVDAVSEVLKIAKRSIEPSPRLNGDQARLLGRVANLEKQKRMIQLLDPNFLIDEQDAAQLAQLKR